jgi:hypothetical protein
MIAPAQSGLALASSPSSKGEGGRSYNNKPLGSENQTNAHCFGVEGRAPWIRLSRAFGPFRETNFEIVTIQYLITAYDIFLRIRFSRAHLQRGCLLHGETNCHKSNSFNQLRLEKFIYDIGILHMHG